MKRTILALVAAGLLGGAVGLSGCYASSATVGVGVEAAPPAAVYYDDYDSRPGYTFIEGRWVWSAYGWQWYPGYWVAARPGFIYVQGYWDYWGGRYVYRPGSWARYRDGRVWIGGRWHVHRPGHYYDYRRGTWTRPTGRWSARGSGAHTGGGARGPSYRTSPGYGRPDHRSPVRGGGGERRGGGGDRGRGGGGGHRHDRR